MSFAWDELEEKYFKRLIESSINVYFERLIEKAWVNCETIYCKRLTNVRFYYAKCNIEIHKVDLNNISFKNVEMIIDRQGEKTKLKNPLYYQGKLFIDRDVYAKRQAEYYIQEDTKDEKETTAHEKWENIMEEMTGIAYISEHGSKEDKEELIMELEAALKRLKEGIESE